MSKLLTESNNHIFICGQTQSGKTYFASNALAQLRRPVLFLNIQEVDLPRNFMKVNDETATGKQLIEALKDGMKIDFRFRHDATMDRINKVIGHLSHMVMTANFSKEKPLYVVLDECHELKKEGLEGGIQIATRGLARGCRGVFITQRPAECSKTLYTQAAEQYIFYIPIQDNEYLRRKGIDYDQCSSFWSSLGDHSYVYSDGYKLEGRRAI